MSEPTAAPAAPPGRAERFAVAFVLLLAGIVLAVHLREVQFFCDDAYISYRYADHLVRGEGLVYNPGERVEGYTNFLWVLVLAAGMAAGLPPEGWSLWAGLIALGFALLLTFRLATRLLGTSLAGALAVLLLVTLGPMILWSSSGLESSLFAALAVAAVLAVHQSRGPRRLLLAGILYGLATLTRPEGVVLGLAAGLHVLGFGATGGRRSLARVALEGGALLGGFLLVFLPFLAWRWSYYGDWLPNTFYAKAESSVHWTLGRRYLHDFIQDHPLLWLLTVAGTCLALGARRFAPVRRTFLHLALALVLFAVYVAWSGGDYMALYRFLVPVLPLAVVFALVPVVLGMEALRARLPRPVLLAGAVLAVAAVGASQLVPSWRSSRRDLPHSVANMRRNSEQWSAAGRALGAAVWKDAWIATTAAGALPYFSGLRTLDQSGLCDRTVAREEWDPWLVDRPGHMKQATRDYLSRRQPDFILWHPLLKAPSKEGRQPMTPVGGYVLRALKVAGISDAAGNEQYLVLFVRADREPAAARAGLIDPMAEWAAPR